MFINLSEKIEKCKEFLKENEKDIFLAVLIILTAFLSFGLGRLSFIFENKEPVKIENAADVLPAISDTSELSKIPAVGPRETDGFKLAPQEKIFVASKNGTKYYFPWCKGVEKIKEENKVRFKTAEEARSRGLEPAKNCKGLK